MAKSYLKTAVEGEDRSSDEGERPPAAAPRLLNIYESLFASYGPQRWWPAQTSFEVVIGAYLTQNTSWRGVERSIENLREQNAITIDGIRGISEDALRRLVRPSGYMVRKAAALKAFVAMLDAEYEGSLGLLADEPTTIARAKLLALPGVGEETADAILLYALEHPVFVVDEYFRRVVTRHNLIALTRPRYGEMQRLVYRAFENFETPARTQHYNEFHALIVTVGKSHCGPSPRCGGCPLAGDLATLDANNV